MRLAEFLIDEEGNDSRKLSDGRFVSTFDKLGKVWNIGPGITVGVTKDTIWTQAQLDAAEAKEFADVEACVARSVKVPLTENQRIACESLAYNIGDAGFEHSSVLHELNAGHMAVAAQDFLLWNHAGGGVCKGLIKRRNDEIRLFNHPDDVAVPADLRAVKTPLTATIAPASIDPAIETAAARLCSGIYAYPQYPAETFDHVIMLADSYYCAVKRIGDTDYVTFRGTVTSMEWIKNCMAWTVDLQGIGHVHAGFNDGLADAWPQIAAVIGKKFVICGHSRGAAQAKICAAYAIRDGKPPLALIVFGAPRAGYQELADLLKTIPAKSYRNTAEAIDPVTAVPVTLAGILPFVNEIPFTDVSVMPTADDVFPDILGEDFKPHFMPLYARAAGAIGAPASPLPLVQAA